ncbi:MAG: hypothetical protein ACM34K_16860 [Bacillota bacterium]
MAALQAVINIIHILSAVVWLGYVPADIVLRKAIKTSSGTKAEGKLISTYLKLTNIAGIIGMTGLLITGILLVSIIPYYFFFDFSSNHWLASKQVIMVILLVLVFALLIPKARKVRLSLGGEIGGTSPVSDEAHKNLKSLETIITIINVLVLINFLFAVGYKKGLF